MVLMTKLSVSDYMSLDGQTPPHTWIDGKKNKQTKKCRLVVVVKHRMCIMSHSLLCYITLKLLYFFVRRLDGSSLSFLQVIQNAAAGLFTGDKQH